MKFIEILKIVGVCVWVMIALALTFMLIMRMLSTIETVGRIEEKLDEFIKNQKPE